MSDASLLRNLDMEIVRAFHAEEIRVAAQVSSAHLIEAFGRVSREKFVGPGPWQIASADAGMGGAVYMATDDADPRHVYHNVSIALDASRDLINGLPPINLCCYIWTIHNLDS
jgi:protein-L-isoaspartate(D-aspartate) O-methyltransferase